MKAVVVFSVMLSLSLFEGVSAYAKQESHSGIRTLARPTSDYPLEKNGNAMSCRLETFLSRTATKIKTSICTATIVAAKAVLTAAHCIAGRNGPKTLYCPGQAPIRISAPFTRNPITKALIKSRKTKNDELVQPHYQRGEDVALLSVRENLGKRAVRIPKSKDEYQNLIRTAKNCTTHGYGSGKQIGIKIDLGKLVGGTKKLLHFATNAVMKIGKRTVPDLFAEEGDSGAGLVCEDVAGNPILLGTLLGRGDGEVVFTSLHAENDWINKTLNAINGKVKADDPSPSKVQLGAADPSPKDSLPAVSKKSRDPKEFDTRADSSSISAISPSNTKTKSEAPTFDKGNGKLLAGDQGDSPFSVSHVDHTNTPPDYQSPRRPRRRITHQPTENTFSQIIDAACTLFRR